MAKNTTPAATAGAFAVESGVELPAITRAVGKTTSPYTESMNALKLPEPYDPKKLNSFFIPASAADNITDANEKAKALKEDARKISNRVSGIARRLTKGKTDELAFAVRTTEKDGHPGVRVFRVKPEPKAAAAAPTTPPPQS